MALDRPTGNHRAYVQATHPSMNYYERLTAVKWYLSNYLYLLWAPTSHKPIVDDMKTSLI